MARQKPLIDMGASFVSAVLADNERLRNENGELNKRLFDNVKSAAIKDRDYLSIIYHLVQKLGGDVMLEGEDIRFDPRRLLIDRHDYGRARRIRLLGDDALGLIREEEVV